MSDSAKPIRAVGFDPATLAHLTAAGILCMSQLVGSTAAQRRERLPDLAIERHHRLTAVLAEMRDEDVRLRCQHLGDAA